MTTTPFNKAPISQLPLCDYRKHRAALMAKMPNNSIALFPAASEVTRSNDTEYAFCQNKNFFYLTGFNESDALLVLLKGEQGHTESILFSLPKDPLHEIWHGRRVGQIKAVQDYGVDESFEVTEIDNLLPDYLDGISQVFFGFSDHTFAAQVFTWLKQVNSSIRQGAKVPQQLNDTDPMVAELRLIKTENELALMRQANYISGLAHQRAMQNCHVGKFEYQVEADILHEFARHGARDAAYACIVAGGDNANILHYTNNSDVLKNNELLLIDAGAELAGYAADITRTFPVNGQFTPEQKAIYQLVLDAKNLAINAIKPGMSFAKLNILTNAFLTQGLVDLGILQGDLTELISDKKIKEYFIHGLGHWLGLDVHDVGDYHINTKREQLRAFEVGMVMTIEPGIYIPLSDLSVEAKWRGIGVRIEDNIAVTATGFENFTANSPQTIEDIEELMKKTQKA
ncbi:Xaa-Pro aminopeptidase [Colwellia sp. 12G3]|uniref:Xaa-Pro aminopeptidase n=1 Tax=Colwellia sp. 12G3 TaxID=2058299 RepID=UPI000C3381BE|nr:Xaa-Pro aminopeptidase [Colwellia sp. 12G3]PKI14332.1 Xaa-Pro aminopeptidase [Colwellia sp. 12G3]